MIHLKEEEQRAYLKVRVSSPPHHPKTAMKSLSLCWQVGKYKTIFCDLGY
jgi:hypothetical protein